MNDNRADDTPGDFANLDDEFAGDPDTAVAPEELARIRDALHGSTPTLDDSLWERLLSTATDPATPDPGADLVTGVETGDLFDVGTPVDEPTAALDDLPDASSSDDTPDGDATDTFTAPSYDAHTTEATHDPFGYDGDDQNDADDGEHPGGDWGSE